jgi:hypothetical protein
MVVASSCGPKDVVYGPPVATSDHKTIFIECRSSDVIDGTLHAVRDYRDSHVDTFVNFLHNCNFNKLFSEVSNDKKAIILHNYLSKAFKLIPCEYVIISSKDKPGMTPKIKLLIHKRNFVFFYKKRFCL